MQNRDWQDFCDLMHGADETVGAAPRSERALKIIFATLSRWSLEDVARAVSELLAVQSRILRPADIIGTIEGSISDRSAVAWQLFKKSVFRWGYYDSVRFPDPAFHYAIDAMGGWERLSKEFLEMTDREIEFREKSWRQLYEIGARSVSWDDVQDHLPGYYERENTRNGFSEFVPEVVSIATRNVARPLAAARHQRLEASVG